MNPYLLAIFSFKFSFLLICGTDVLFAATGLFDAADIPGLTWDKHINRLTTLEVAKHNNRVPASVIDISGIGTIIDICNVPSGEHGLPVASGTPKRGLDLITHVDPPKESESMLDYKNSWEVEVEHGTIFSRPMFDSPGLQQENTLDQDQKLREKNLTPSPGLQRGRDDTSAPRSMLVRHVQPQYKVTMRGHAIRMGFPIDAPNLKLYAGRDVFKYGLDRYKESKIVVGAVSSSGSRSGVTTIYRLDWEKSYVLDDVPSIGEPSSPGTDGHEETFV